MPLKGRANVDKMIGKSYENINDDVRGVFFSGLVAIVKGTPVDEGRARNNWFFSEGIPSSRKTSSKAKGLAAFRSANEMPKRVFNRKLYFTNNLPYIETLEYGGYPDPNKGKKTVGGFSKQAPSGWVRGVVIRMRNKIRKL